MTTSQHAKWSRRYRRCMGKVWMHPDNDQRAAVLSWLPSRIPAGAAIVDVGAGENESAAFAEGDEDVERGGGHGEEGISEE